MKHPRRPCWLTEWAGTVVGWAEGFGFGWRTPATRRSEFKVWRKAYRVEQEYARMLAEGRRLGVERTRLALAKARALASVPPVVYHGDTPSKEPVVTISAPDPLQPSATLTSRPPYMDQPPNPTSVIYLFVVEKNDDGKYQVMRASSENPTVPNLNTESVEDDDDFGTFDTSERALAVAKKLNDEERARRFA